MKAFVRSAAQADILRQYRYYLVSQDVPAIASQFLDAVEEAMRAIARQPGIGSPKLLRNKGLKGLRGRLVPGFESTKIYYLESPTTLRIIRVLHGRRDVTRILEREDPAID